jgi:hypothetical protein
MGISLNAYLAYLGRTLASFTGVFDSNKFAFEYVPSPLPLCHLSASPHPAAQRRRAGCGENLRPLPPHREVPLPRRPVDTVRL